MSCCEECETNDNYTYSKDTSVETKTCIPVCFCSASYHYLMMGVYNNLDQSNHEREVKEEMFSHSHLSHLVTFYFFTRRVHAVILRYKFTTKSSASSSKTIFISSNIEFVLHPPSLANSFIMKSMRVFSSSPR